MMRPVLRYNNPQRKKCVQPRRNKLYIQRAQHPQPRHRRGSQATAWRAASIIRISLLGLSRPNSPEHIDEEVSHHEVPKIKKCTARWAKVRTEGDHAKHRGSTTRVPQDKNVQEISLASSISFAGERDLCRGDVMLAAGGKVLMSNLAFAHSATNGEDSISSLSYWRHKAVQAGNLRLKTECSLSQKAAASLINLPPPCL